MRTIVTSLALAAACLSPAGAQTQPQSNVAKVEEALRRLLPPVRIEGRSYEPRPIEEVMRRVEVPGVSIALIDDGELVWARAFGLADTGTGRAVTPDTMFQAASISKPVAASGALVLVDQGLLSLDRPVNERLTSWKVPEHELGGEPVTLRHLLTHTGGLTVHGFPGYPRGDQLPTVVQILDGTEPANTAPVRVDLRPGSEWRYSGGGFTIAQLLMTDAAEEEFPGLMKRLVLDPLQMTRSTYRQPLPEDALGGAAVAHQGDGEPLPAGHHVYPEMAAAGLWTTPSDLARWAAAISSAFHGGTAGPIRPETAQAMLTRGEGDWGLGLGVTGEGEWLRFSHGGSNQGFRAMLIAYPNRGQGIAVMTNSEGGARIAAAITQAVGRALGWPDSQAHMIVPAPVSRNALMARVGRYANEDMSVNIALADGDRLLVVPGEGESFEIVPQEDGVWVAPSRGLRLRFRTAVSGEVTAISAGRTVLERTP